MHGRYCSNMGGHWSGGRAYCLDSIEDAADPLRHKPRIRCIAVHLQHHVSERAREKRMQGAG